MGNRAVATLLGGSRTTTATVATVNRATHVARDAQGSTRTSGTGATSPPGVASNDFMGPGWIPLAKTGLVYKVEGVFLRDKPLPGSQSNILVPLAQNTHVTIMRWDPIGKWYAVRVLGGPHDALIGYAAQSHVRDDLPDADAVMHLVQPNEQLGSLVQNHPQYADYPIRTGDDARSLAAAVCAANTSSGGVRLNLERFEDEDSWWERAQDSLDEYRREMRRIYQSVELVAGRLIWLPSVTYVQQMKVAGIIPTRSDELNKAVELGKAIGGFTIGMHDGFMGALQDAVEGLYELGESIVDLVISAIRGELAEKAQELYDWFSALTEKEIEELAVQVVTGLIGAQVKSVEEFITRWTKGQVYDIWHFRGRVVGGILAQVAMALISGGIGAVGNWAARFGKVGMRLRKIVDKVTPDVRRHLPDRKRRPGDRGDKDADVGERAIALLKARTVAEIHDAANSPVPGVLAALAPLKKYKGVSGFRAMQTGPGQYQIVMRSIVDDDYTPAAGSASRKTFDDSDPDVQQGVPMSEGEYMKRRDRDAQWGMSSKTAAGTLTHDKLWCRGARNVDVFPKRIAEKMVGRDFRNWQEFRETFWKHVAADPELSKHFNLRQWPADRRAQGHAPFVRSSEQGRGVTWQISHKDPVRGGENPYRLDNLELVTPKAHVELERID